MSDALADLYQQVILDHGKRPRRAGLREPFDVEVHHLNPVCGDEVTLRVRLDGDGPAATVVDVSYDALGCTISVAATSVMAAAVTGGTVAAALAESDRFRAVTTGAVALDDETAAEDDAAAFAGVARVPRRVKCALLGPTALREALVRAAG